MKKIIVTLIIFLINFMTCYSYAISMPKVKPEKLKQMQEHIYDTSDAELLRQSVVAVLQDNDFIIQEIDFNLGYIRAQKIYKAHYTNKKRLIGWGAVFALATAYTVFSYGSTAASMYSPSRRIITEMKDKTVVVDSNIFIEPVSENKIKVKFIPVAKILQNADGFSFYNSNPIRVLRIYKKEIYNEFFSQINGYIQI